MAKQIRPEILHSPGEGTPPTPGESRALPTVLLEEEAGSCSCGGGCKCGCQSGGSCGCGGACCH
ncbi:MAG: hypothetical protein ACJ786_33250 [Catenulispora sp.]